MDVPQDLLTTGQAARLLGCTRQHVVDLCQRGDLPFVLVGSHRRLHRADVTALTQRSLTRDQERSLWLHQVVAGRLAVDPEGVLARARKNLDQLQRVHAAGPASAWLAEWGRLLAGNLDAIFDALTSRSPRAVELRQNSPFAGVLDPRERENALAAFRTHWRSTHAA